MQLRTLGSSGLLVSPVCLGTMTFGTPVGESGAIRLTHAAIDLGICFSISRTDEPGVHVFAVDVDQVATVETTDTQKVPGADWANYVKGVFHYLQQHLGQKIDGLDCTFKGSIPMGAGLSSSAALEEKTSSQTPSTTS